MATSSAIASSLRQESTTSLAGTPFSIFELPSRDRKLRMVVVFTEHAMPGGWLGGRHPGHCSLRLGTAGRAGGACLSERLEPAQDVGRPAAAQAGHLGERADPRDRRPFVGTHPLTSLCWSSRVMQRATYPPAWWTNDVLPCGSTW